MTTTTGTGKYEALLERCRNLEPVPLKMWVLYIKPAGTPLSVDAPDPGCGFA